MSWRLIKGLVLLAGLLTAWPPEALAQAVGVSGTVVFNGADPDQPLPMDVQPGCVAMHSEPALSQRIVRGDGGGLANALVVLEGAGLPPLAVGSDPVLLTQQGCLYSPRVIALQVGQELVVRNEDMLLHNVHAHTKVNPGFNVGQPFKGVESKRSFQEPELGIAIRCDIHPWMVSFVHVLDHGYALVTGVDGTFEWPSVPAGRYKVTVWHDELGSRSVDVEVSAGQQTPITISFDP